MVDARRRGLRAISCAAAIAAAFGLGLAGCGDGDSSSPAAPEVSEAGVPVLTLPGIYTVGSDGDVEAITTDPGSYHALAWSPDGSRLAYAVETASGTEVRVVTLESRETRTLGASPVATRAATSWAPSGASLAYVLDDGLEARLVATTPDGLDARVLSQHPAGEAAGLGVAWSPDGSRIALVRSIAEAELQEGEGETREQIDVVLVSLDGSQARLTGDQLIERDPEWTADGEILGFTLDADGEQTVAAVLVAAGEATTFAGIPGEHVLGGIAPSGELLAVVSANEGTAALSVHALGGEGVSSVSSVDGLLSPVAWAPDGSRLAFTRAGVRSAATDGSDERELAALDGVSVVELGWSPDGSRLAVVAEG